MSREPTHRNDVDLRRRWLTVALRVIRAEAPQTRSLRCCGAWDRAGRLRAGLRFSHSMIALSRAGLRARNPDLDERALKLLWIEQNYGAELARKVERHQRAVGWTRPTTSS